MNKAQIIGVISFMALLTFAVFYSVNRSVDAAPATKVTICHATSSETNPWVRIVVSENAIGGHFDNPGTPKAGHEDDVLLQGEVDCPPVEEPPVVDVCENLEGNQSEVPDGYIQKDGLCLIETDEPDNTPSIPSTPENDVTPSTSLK